MPCPPEKSSRFRKFIAPRVLDRFEYLWWRNIEIFLWSFSRLHEKFLLAKYLKKGPRHLIKSKGISSQKTICNVSQELQEIDLQINTTVFQLMAKWLCRWHLSPVQIVLSLILCAMNFFVILIKFFRPRHSLAFRNYELLEFTNISSACKMRQ